jgi:hypothetical protein
MPAHSGLLERTGCCADRPLRRWQQHPPFCCRRVGGGQTAGLIVQVAEPSLFGWVVLLELTHDEQAVPNHVERTLHFLCCG